MKKVLKPVLLASSLALLFTACKKDAKDMKVDDISPAVRSQIQSLGFSTNDVRKVDDGYLVEGDIVLTQNDLAYASSSPEIVYANEEHYRTNNLVKVSSYPTIKVALNNSSSQHQAVFSAALDEAIRRYNAESLTIKFQRVSSSANTTVVAFYEVSNTLGSSGFPTSSGAPYSQVKMNTYWYSTSTSSTNVNYIATIMAHELGHCIGFRHTDYMNRAYSCGGSAVNEGSAGVGAVYIPGTPSGPSANSWMLACVGSNQNRPFTSADRTALNYLY
ncbi:M57 family metalloprotease [Flavisolibacter nicotianae]|uniref:M57 family metalloprotease n=1 Tax=Flavisolibacter nicotianae TaxID=2364882 RepID=UPI000EB33D2C|nr:M57 family metalloprotease [Flavisolibacter nicotianae]